MNLKQVVVILGATVLAGFGVWGNLLLRQEFQIRQVNTYSALANFAVLLATTHLE